MKYAGETVKDAYDVPWLMLDCKLHCRICKNEF